MNDFDTPQNELEHAIAAVAAVAAAGEDDPGDKTKRAVMIALATNTVTVMLPELAEDGSPPENPQPLFVSDGPNLEQPMLAAFTRPERAGIFRRSMAPRRWLSK